MVAFGMDTGHAAHPVADGLVHKVLYFRLSVEYRIVRVYVQMYEVFHDGCSFVLFPYYHAAAGLMGGQNQHLCYLHMLRSIGSIDGHIGNVVTC